MKKPNHIAPENWEILIRPENEWHRFALGFAEPGQKTKDGKIEFIGNYSVKKLADFMANENSLYKVHPYINGKLRRGWVVLCHFPKE